MSKQLVALKERVVGVVETKVRGFIESNQLNLPADYSPENALKSAWLILQQTQDRNKKPVLEVCDNVSVSNALLDMIVQALNPAKKQCYFIAYGKQLVCQRSYFGSVAVAKMFAGVKDVFAQVVWEGDEFEYAIDMGNKSIVKHVQKLENVGSNPVAAYCVLALDDGSKYTDIMTFEQVKQAWKQSQMKPVDDKGKIKAGSTHDKFQEEMIRKTVINRACKKYINTSSDHSLLIERFNRTSDVIAEAEFAEELETQANQTLIDIKPDEEAQALEAAGSDGAVVEDERETFTCEIDVKSQVTRDVCQACPEVLGCDTAKGKGVETEAT